MQNGDWTEWSRHILSSLENLNKNVDKLKDEQINLSKVLLRNTITVEEHHRRSTLLEEELRKIETDIHKVKDHVTRVEGIGKGIRWLGYIAGSVTAVAGALKVLGMF